MHLTIVADEWLISDYFEGRSVRKPSAQFEVVFKIAFETRTGNWFSQFIGSRTASAASVSDPGDMT